MTTQKKDDIRAYFSVATFITLIGVFALQVRWQERTDARLEVLEQFQNNKDIHPTYQENSKWFMPRGELEQRLDSFEKNQEKTNNKLDKLLDRI